MNLWFSHFSTIKKYPMIEIINEPVNSYVLDKWKIELDKIVNTLKKLEANTLKAEITYTNATQWEAKLRGWLDNLLQTAALTQQLEAELTLFYAQLSAVSTSTQYVVQAIDILFREVKKVFIDPALKDTSKCYPCDVETIGQMIRGIQNDVNCLGNLPNLNKGGGFLKKLTELEAKLKAVEDVREDILKKMIALVQSANLMSSSINNVDGLKGIVHTMQCEYSSGSNTKDEASNLTKPLHMPRNCGCHATDDVTHSCTSELSPIICFPLSSDPFVDEIAVNLGLSTTEKDKAAENFNACRKERDRVLARKNGLEKAIAAALAAKK
jgi:hypothetical protein